MRIATWCPYCGFFQYTEFMNHAYCKQCGKTFSPEKAKGVELRSATSIENLEKEMLDEISRLSVKEHLIYCLFVVCTKFGCDVQYKPKRLFKKDMFDDYIFNDTHVGIRYRKMYNIFDTLSHKYNLVIKPYYFVNKNNDKTFGIAFYLSTEDIVRIQTILKDRKRKESENIFLQAKRNTLGEESVQNLQHSPIIEKTKWYLYKLYGSELNSKHKEKCHVYICLYDHCICFDSDIYENENSISFYSQNFSNIKTAQERNTLFIALYNCLDSFLNEYSTIITKHYAFFDYPETARSSSYLAISASVSLFTQKPDLKSMFEP